MERRYEQDLQASVFGHLRRLADDQGKESWPLLHLRRRLVGSEALLDFPPLKDLAAAGATDYFAALVGFGDGKDVSRGNGIGYSVATDRPEGFRDDDLVLLKAVLPVVSLAIASYAGHRIAAGLLAAYLPIGASSSPLKPSRRRSGSTRASCRRRTPRMQRHGARARSTRSA